MPNDLTDSLLSRLSAYSPEFGAGFSNHASMTMRALTHILPEAGPERLEAFFSKAEARLERWPKGAAPVNDENHAEALGDPGRRSDWRDFFLSRLSSDKWENALREWAPRLLPGVMAGATHGLIRTAYAVDYLREKDTPTRRGELAIALSHWASRYQPLPDGEGAPESSDPAELLEKIKTLPAEKRVRGLIFDRVKPLDNFEPFRKVRSMLAVEDTEAALNGISRAAASLYLQNNGRSAITFIHCLTATHALRMLRPSLPADLLPTAVSYLWQAVAALYAADCDAPWKKDFEPRATGREADLKGSWKDMLSLAAPVDTDHVVKYAWSTSEENRVNPNPVYATALARWLVKSGL